jgi:glycosyltransferase involved in cell wall biosynthesis
MPVIPLDERASPLKERSRRIALLVPAYEVRPWSPEFRVRLARAFAALRAQYDAQIWLVFVDDGSFEPGTHLRNHAKALAEIGCAVVRTRHCFNRGQGAALQTALELARSPAIDADLFVTMDADGQHDPADLVEMVRPLVQERANITFGNRFTGDLRTTGIPFMRLGLLKLAAVFEFLVSGVRLADAHNGFRAFDRAAADLIELKQDRMAHATEFKQLVALRNLRFAEVPVRITYDAETIRAGQGNLNAINILRELTRGWWLH